MVKRKWLWGKRSAEKIGGETESSDSMSLHSDMIPEDQQEMLKGSGTNIESQEIYCKAIKSEDEIDEIKQKPSSAPAINGSEDSLPKQNASKTSINGETQQISKFSIDGSKDSSFNENVSTISMKETQDEQVSLQASNTCKEDNESLKLLTEKLSAALESVSLKDDLVKQHSKVAEEAVAGWEKAEQEAAAMKQQLEDALQKKSSMEDRVNHLDEALKECVRQLRLARDEQERKINQAVAEKTNVLESAKTKLEEQLVELQALVESSRMTSPDLEHQHKIDFLEKENVLFKQELQSMSEELEVRTIERDLSTKAAETASKQHLESIKKVARLEAECRRLKSLSRASSLSNECKYSATAAASCVESLTDCRSDGASECESHKMNGSWASALVAELDQFKSEKVGDKNMVSSSMDINLMDDFLEMERLVNLPDSKPQVCSGGFNESPEKPLPEADSRLKLSLNQWLVELVNLKKNYAKWKQKRMN
ncbi:Filament-like plant protein [Bienertia sinuspersici]